jgi:hypothetical protein
VLVLSNKPLMVLLLAVKGLRWRQPKADPSRTTNTDHQSSSANEISQNFTDASSKVRVKKLATTFSWDVGKAGLTPHPNPRSGSQKFTTKKSVLHPHFWTKHGMSSQHSKQKSQLIFTNRLLSSALVRERSWIAQHDTTK